MGTYTPTIEIFNFNWSWTWVENSGQWIPNNISPSWNSKTVSIPLDAIPNGAEITGVEYSTEKTNSPTIFSEKNAVQKLTDSSGTTLTDNNRNTVILEYLQGLNKQYTGKTLDIYYAAQCGVGSRSTRPSSSSLKVTYQPSCTIKYSAYVFYGDTGVWVPCEMYYGENGEWVQVTPYVGKNGEWVQA